MLPNRLTGEDREVDVVLRTTTAGHETVIAIEAAARGRPATVDWIEQMIGKHHNLPTDKVVLVAEKGFSKQALVLARAENMVPLAPEDAADDEGVLRALSSLWPKTVTLTPERVTISVRRSDDRVVSFSAPADLPIVLGDDTEVD